MMTFVLQCVKQMLIYVAFRAYGDLYRMSAVVLHKCRPQDVFASSLTLSCPWILQLNDKLRVMSKHVFESVKHGLLSIVSELE